MSDKVWYDFTFAIQSPDGRDMGTFKTQAGTVTEAMLEFNCHPVVSDLTMPEIGTIVITCTRLEHFDPNRYLEATFSINVGEPK